MARNEKKVRHFSALEVANICGVVNQTAINWIRRGHLKAFTTPGGQYRVYAEELYEFLRSRQMKIPGEVESTRVKETFRLRLLIIDNDREFNNHLKECIEHELSGLNVRQAFDGYEAGRIISSWKPGTVILNLDLPGMEGADLSRRIKEDPELSHPFLLGVSLGQKGEREVLRLKQVVNSFWVKPFDPGEMVLAIRSYLNKE